MKTKLLFFLVLFFIIFIFFLFSKLLPKNENQSKKIIKVGNTKITVELAETESKRSQGLSNRNFLPQDWGMLFVFPNKASYSFWMKNMKFPLDFIWISGTKVVEITENVPYPKNGKSSTIIQPKIAVDKVIEVNAGIIKLTGVKIGDQISGL